MSKGSGPPLFPTSWSVHTISHRAQGPACQFRAPSRPCARHGCIYETVWPCKKLRCFHNDMAICHTLPLTSTSMLRCVPTRAILQMPSGQAATMQWRTLVAVTALCGLNWRTSDAKGCVANAQGMPGVLSIGLQAPAEYQIWPEALRRDLQDASDAHSLRLVREAT